MKSALQRTGGLIILLLSLAWLCRKPGWDSLITFATALVAYIGLDIWNSVRSVSNHDAGLAKKFLQLVAPTSSTVQLLRSHDFAVPFHSDDIDPLFRINDLWRGVGYEFQDKKLERARRAFLLKLHQFVEMLSGSTWPHGQNSRLITMDFHDWDNSPEKIATREKLNELGSEVLEEYEKFVRVIRFKIK